MTEGQEESKWGSRVGSGWKENHRLGKTILPETTMAAKYTQLSRFKISLNLANYERNDRKKKEKE